MASDRRRTCQVCGLHEREVGSISWRGKCARCADNRNRDNFEQMMSRSGPNFERWRRSMVLCAHPELLDALDGKH